MYEYVVSSHDKLLSKRQLGADTLVTVFDCSVRRHHFSRYDVAVVRRPIVTSTTTSSLLTPRSVDIDARSCFRGGVQGGLL